MAVYGNFTLVQTTLNTFSMWILSKHRVFCREFGFIEYEVNGRLFSNVSLALPVLVHLARPCLVEAECVE